MKAALKNQRPWMIMTGFFFLSIGHLATSANAASDKVAELRKSIRDLDGKISEAKDPKKTATQCASCGTAYQDHGYNGCNTVNSPNVPSAENEAAWAEWRKTAPFKDLFDQYYGGNERGLKSWNFGSALDDQGKKGSDPDQMSCVVMYKVLTSADRPKGFSDAYANSCLNYIKSESISGQCSALQVAKLEKEKADLTAQLDAAEKDHSPEVIAKNDGDRRGPAGADYGDKSDGPSGGSGGSSGKDGKPINCTTGNCEGSQPQRGGVDPTLVNGILGFMNIMFQYDLGKQQVNTQRMYHRGIESAYQSCLDADMQVGYRTNCGQMMTNYMCTGAPYGCQGGAGYPTGYNPYTYGQYPWQNGNGSNFWNQNYMGGGNGIPGVSINGGGAGIWTNMSLGGGICMGGGTGCGQNSGGYQQNGAMFGSNPYGNYNQYGYNGSGGFTPSMGGNMYSGMQQGGIFGNGGMMGGGQFNQGYYNQPYYNQSNFQQGGGTGYYQPSLF